MTAGAGKIMGAGEKEYHALRLYPTAPWNPYVSQR